MYKQENTNGRTLKNYYRIFKIFITFIVGLLNFFFSDPELITLFLCTVQTVAKLRFYLRSNFSKAAPLVQKILSFIPYKSE